MASFYIGRKLFSGLNRFEHCESYQAAYKELLRRGVTIEDAHTALKSAMGRQSSEAKVWYRGISKIIEVNLVQPSSTEPHAQYRPAPEHTFELIQKAEPGKPRVFRVQSGQGRVPAVPPGPGQRT